MTLVKSVSVRISEDGAEATRLKIDRLTVRAEELASLDPTIRPQVDIAAASVKLGLLKAELKRSVADMGATPAPGLDVLQARLAGLAGRVTTARVDVADKDAVAKLAAIRARLAVLGDKVSEPRISVSGAARAEAEIAAVAASLDHLSDKSGGGGFGGLLSKIGVTGSQLGGLGPVGLGAAAAAAAMLASMLASALPPLAAATMGVAAFGALAVPTLTKVHDAVAKIAQDTAAYHAATTAASKATDLAKIKADWAALTPEQAKLVKGVQSFQSAWAAASAKIAPAVMGVLNDGLKIANRLLPDLVPFAQAAAKAIGGLLRQLDRFAGSQGFKTWLAEMLKMTGPAITTIGHGIGQVAIALGKFLRQVATPQGMSVLSGIFSAVAGSIRGIGAAIHFVDGVNQIWARSMIATGEVGLNVAHAITIGFLDMFSSVAHAAAAFATALHLPFARLLRQDAADFDRWRSNVDGAFASARSTLDGWAGALQRAPKIFKLQGDITDLQAKLATARSQLSDPHLTATRRARVEADISQLSIAVARARAQLLALQGMSVTTFIQTVATGIPGHAIQHAGGGFVAPQPGRGRYARIIAGEQGPEAIDLPAGSYVHTATATRQMAARGAGNTYNITVNVPPSASNAAVGREIVACIKDFERGSGKGWRS